MKVGKPALSDEAEARTIEEVEIEHNGPFLTATKESAETNTSVPEKHSSVSNTNPEDSQKDPTSSDQDGFKRRRLVRPTSCESDHVSPRTKREIETDGLDRNITPSTSSSEILETLMAASFARQEGSILLQFLKQRKYEREPILVFDGLHLRNIQRLQLRLLEISRGCANPPVTNEDEVHLLLHQYREF
jgi:hypothetical protein